MRSLYMHKGMSIGEVAAFADTGRRTARKWLRDAGIPQRTMSEDKALQMARLTPEERELQMAACREAVRGMAQSDEHRFKIARTKQDRAVLSGDESTILAALNAVGLHPVPLYAIHRYNIDFGFPEIKLAVEYNGGNWHHTPKKQREDAAKRAWLEADGWTVVYFPRLKQEPIDPNGSARIALADLVAEVQRLAHR
jgi:very-short-patch-repair endonuclease